jgi:hypothetical protein
VINPSELVQLILIRSNDRSNIISILMNSSIDHDKIKCSIEHPISCFELHRLIVKGSNVQSEIRLILMNLID